VELERRFSHYGYEIGNPIRNIDVERMWTETVNGCRSDNAEEEQTFFNKSNHLVNLVRTRIRATIAFLV